MTAPSNKPDAGDKFVQAYNRMIERVKTAFEQAEKSAIPTLQRNIDTAVEKAVELGELTREEAERIGEYVKRDLHDAGDYLADTGSDLGEWLRFDLELIEERLLDMFGAAADRTRLELLELEARARRTTHYRTGEITGPGTLQCAQCNNLVHFHTTGHIPPCPSCHATEFRRVGEET